jgi:hypothetical protein
MMRSRLPCLIEAVANVAVGFVVTLARRPSYFHYLPQGIDREQLRNRRHIHCGIARAQFYITAAVRSYSHAQTKFGQVLISRGVRQRPV